MKIFLAFSFRDEDKGVVANVEDVLASHDIWIVNGKDVGGEQLTPAVQARIEQCDGLIGLLTRRDKLAGGGWTTHDWVRDEISHARSNKIKAFTLVETDVNVGGMYQSHESFPLDRDNPLPALMKLSRTIGEWRRELGRTIKVQILPPSLAKKLGPGGSGISCSHRLWLKGKYTDWREITPVPEEGGTFVYIEGVQDEHLVQLQVEDQNVVWQSPASSQWMQVKLSRGGGK